MDIDHLIIEHQLPSSYKDTVSRYIWPLAKAVSDLYSRLGRPVLINVNGSQGSGKSTLVTFLQALLEKECHLSAANLSLDDFYLTREERQRLAADIHPLLMTRGVPGTHDLPLMRRVITDLLAGHAATIPRFNKAIDDRAAESLWTQQPAVKVVLFEGWCNGCPAQPTKQLQVPVNQLEADEDAQGIWRTYANNALSDYHRQVFSKTDLMVMLQVPGFEAVYEWRALQEQKLREKSTHVADGVMDEKQLERFIQHYQRLTQWGLEKLPGGLADILLPVDRQHQITAILQKQDEGYLPINPLSST